MVKNIALAAIIGLFAANTATIAATKEETKQMPAATETEKDSMKGGAEETKDMEKEKKAEAGK